MKPVHRAILLELAELDALVGDQILNGWWGPSHVRYYRTPNPLAERGVHLDQVKSHLRALAADGLVERKEGKAALYRISEQGRQALRAEEIDEDTRHRMVELSIPAGATVAQLVERIAEEMAEGDRLRYHLDRLENDVRRLERERP